MENGSLQQLVDSMPIGYAKLKLILDGQGKHIDSQFTYVNKMVEHTFDIHSQDIVGKSLAQLINSNYKIAAAWAQTGKDNLLVPRNTPYRHHDVETDRYYKIVITHAEEGYVNALIVDITDELLVERESKKLAESMGGKFLGLYVTMGEYDVVAVTEGPSDEMASAIALSIASKGNVKTTTMRAFTESEFSAIVTKIP